MDNIFLSDAINDYPFAGADLNGCINDQQDMINICQPLGVIIEPYQNSQCTHDNMVNRIKKIAAILKTGSFTYHYSGHGTYGEDPLLVEPDGLREGIYCYDGNIFWDYELIQAFSLFRSTVEVLIIMDSCFSGGYSRLIGNPLIKSKYYQITDKPKSTKPRSKTEKINGVLISGCGENQTSADAFIGGRYNGALSYFMTHSFSAGMSQRQWFETSNKALIRSGKFEQRPELLGTGNPDTGCFGQPVTKLQKGCLLKFLPI